MLHKKGKESVICTGSMRAIVNTAILWVRERTATTTCRSVHPAGQGGGEGVGIGKGAVGEAGVQEGIVKQQSVHA